MVHSHSCAAITATNFQNILITPRRHPGPISCHSPFPLPQHWADLRSVSKNVLVLDISHTESYSTWPLCLTSFTQLSKFSRFSRL